MVKLVSFLMATTSFLLIDAGVTDITHVAEWLKDVGLKFDAIITSPLKRAY